MYLAFARDDAGLHHRGDQPLVDNVRVRARISIGVPEDQLRFPLLQFQFLQRIDDHRGHRDLPNACLGFRWTDLSELVGALIDADFAVPEVNVLPVQTAYLG